MRHVTPQALAVLPRHEVPRLVGEPLDALLVSAGLARSRNEARRLIAQGGVSLLRPVANPPKE